MRERCRGDLIFSMEWDSEGITDYLKEKGEQGFELIKVKRGRPIFEKTNQPIDYCIAYIGKYKNDGIEDESYYTDIMDRAKDLGWDYVCMTGNIAIFSSQTIGLPAIQSKLVQSRHGRVSRNRNIVSYACTIFLMLMVMLIWEGPKSVLDVSIMTYLGPIFIIGLGIISIIMLSIVLYIEIKEVTPKYLKKIYRRQTLWLVGLLVIVGFGIFIDTLFGGKDVAIGILMIGGTTAIGGWAIQKYRVFKKKYYLYVGVILLVIGAFGINFSNRWIMGEINLYSYQSDREEYPFVVIEDFEMIMGDMLEQEWEASYRKTGSMLVPTQIQYRLYDESILLNSEFYQAINLEIAQQLFEEQVESQKRWRGEVIELKSEPFDQVIAVGNVLFIRQGNQVSVVEFRYMQEDYTLEPEVIKIIFDKLQ